MQHSQHRFLYEVTTEDGRKAWSSLFTVPYESVAGYALRETRTDHPNCMNNPSCIDRTESAQVEPRTP